MRETPITEALRSVSAMWDDFNDPDHANFQARLSGRKASGLQAAMTHEKAPGSL
jgi:hypothetical protein